MTSFDLRRIVAEELARAERSLDAFDVRKDRIKFDPVRAFISDVAKLVSRA